MSTDDTSPADLTARRGYHHGNLREALVEAARRLTAERGPYGFTMAEAARLAGVSASAPYRHFKDRDALLGELSRRGFAIFGARLAEAARAAANGFTGMGHAYLAFAREEPGYYGAMFDWRAPDAPRPPNAPKEGGDAPFDTLVGAIARLLPAGGATEGVRLLALEVWAVSHGIAGLERAGMSARGPGAPSSEAVLEDAVRRLIKGG
jgi:AcrR family transcriptional regulator